MSDLVTLKVAGVLYRAAERAYAFPREHDEGWDPELCAGCQRVRPAAGSELCTTCQEEQPC